jgi:SAM-dependent methyltransferase
MTFHTKVSAKSTLKTGDVLHCMVFFVFFMAVIFGCERQSVRAAVDPPVVDSAKQELKEIRTPDILFVPTPQEVVDKMLELADVKKDDLVYDLGCGDGRIVVTAAKKFGCKGVGYDIDPQRVIDSLANVKKNNVEDLVNIFQKDIFTLDLSKANVITLYLLSSLNVKLIPQLEQVKPGTRIVSHDFDMQGIVTPDKTVTVSSGEYSQHTVYLWIAPLKKNTSK